MKIIFWEKTTKKKSVLSFHRPRKIPNRNSVSWALLISASGESERVVRALATDEILFKLVSTHQRDKKKKLKEVATRKIRVWSRPKKNAAAAANKIK